MPTVPSYNNLQTSVGGLPNAQFQSPSGPTPGAIAADQASNFGRAAMSAGDSVAKIALDAQDQANQVRVNDAMNQARQQVLNLTYDPQNGFKNLKGDAALTRPDGKSLAEEYGSKLQETIDGISDGLGNSVQKRAFQMQSTNLATQFQGDVDSHTLSEYRNYALTTQDGTVKLGVDAAKLGWNNPDAIAPAIDSIKGAVAEAGRISGEGASETMAKMKTATSVAHLGVIESALQNNNPEYALAYLDNKKNTAEMTADDLLRARGVINKDVYARIADGTATNVMSSLRSRVMPTDVDRMINITRQTESGGNPNAVGPNVPGQGTAKGDMQVMDATAANPGFGIKPADPNVPGDRSRVGRELMTALVSKYGGDAQKAWAAYNAGSGNVDKAIADAGKSGGNWLDSLAAYQSPANHQETVSYVAKNMAALESGGGTPARPTLQDVHDGIREKLGPSAKPDVLKMALEAGTKQFEDMNKDLTQKGHDAESQAQQWLISNNGAFTQMPIGLRTQVTQFAPGKMDDLMKFAKAVSKGDNETSPELYMKLSTYPEEMAKMPDPAFMQLRTQLSEADFKHFSKERADYINGKTDTSYEGLNSKALNQVLDNRIANLGLDPRPKETDTAALARIGNMQKMARDSIYAQQIQLGRKMTPLEIEQQVDGLFAKNINFRNTFAGIETGGTTATNMMGMVWKDVPSSSQDTINKIFADNRQPNAGDSDKLRYYWTWKTKNAK